MESGKFRLAFDKPFLKEFVVKTDLDVKKINRRLLDAGIMGGLDLGNGMIEFAVTEKRTREEIDKLVTLMLQED